MKKLNYILLLIAWLLVGSSCEDDFDPKIFGTLNPDNFPSNEAEYKQYALACYIPFTTTWTYYLGSGPRQHSFYIPEGGTIRMFDTTSDAMAVWNSGGWGEWVQFSEADFTNCVYYDRSGVSADNTNNIPKLSQITRFTDIIATLEKANDQLFYTISKKQLIGEGHLCRGLMMYYLMHIYGPLPAIVNVQDVANEDALNNLVRPSLDEMCSWIYNDFDMAIKSLPEKVEEKGRYTADYARFCLMKHCLNEGEHREGYYSKALEMYKELKATNCYRLFKEGNNPYMDMYRAKNDFNCEIIMAVSCDPSADGGDSSGNFFPISMLITPGDAAKVDKDGNPTPFYYQGKGWAQYFNVSPKLYDTYEPGDKRREVILTEYWVDGGNGEVTTKRTKEDLGVRWDGYIINKYPIETNSAYQGNDFPLARWADVLLMMAEAEVRNTGMAPSAEAIAAVNEVRNRAGLGNLSAQQTGSKEAFLDAILDERGKEFLYEGQRKIDLIRFNTYAQACYKTKGILPTHQYIPLPNYFIDQARTYGKDLKQTYSRPGWEEDLLKTNN